MQLQKLDPQMNPCSYEVIEIFNDLINYCNSLEKRLDVLEGKRCACSKIGGVCPTHYVK